jgi:hypothetical protein
MQRARKPRRTRADDQYIRFQLFPLRHDSAILTKAS